MNFSSLTVTELTSWVTTALILLSTCVEFAPIKINPLSAIFKRLGQAMNADVLKELADVKKEQQETRKRLDDHVNLADERRADDHRARILRFNNELIRGLPHTREDYIDILADIDYYENYCRTHKEYENGRAVHAIANINRLYDEHLHRGDFYE